MKRDSDLTMRELKRLAYQLTAQRGFRHTFKQETEMAGGDWIQYFMRRHPELGMRKRVQFLECVQ